MKKDRIKEKRYRKVTKYEVVKNTKMENFALLNKMAKKGQVVMLGDSIIELFPTYELFADKDKIVYNRGISGDTTDRMVERLKNNALNILPSVLYILCGTNDIMVGLTHEEIVTNLSKTIDEAKAINVAKIIISCVLPVNKKINPFTVNKRKNAEIIELNIKISELCKQKGVIFADIFDKLVDNNGNFNEMYTFDGLHPNARGYVKIAEEIEKLIFV